MVQARRTPGGLIVFPAIKMSEGPPARWAALAVDRRLPQDRFAIGSGSSEHAAEVEALAKLGATPNTVRAALALTEDGTDSPPPADDNGGNGEGPGPR